MQLEKSIRLFEQIMRTVQSIHDMDIYHFDIKPDNILSDGVNHVLIDFGSSQLIKKKHIIPLDCAQGEQAPYAYAVEVSKAFAPTKYCLPNEKVNAEKFDAYSLGCVFFNMITGQYLSGWMSRNTVQYTKLKASYGVLVADLISGLTHRDECVRLTVRQALEHPLFKH